MRTQDIQVGDDGAQKDVLTRCVEAGLGLHNDQTCGANRGVCRTKVPQKLRYRYVEFPRGESGVVRVRLHLIFMAVEAG